MIKKYGILVTILLLWMGLNAQEESETESGLKHQLALLVGYTHIPSGFEEGKKTDALFVPTVGVDYFILFKEKWKLGLVVDYEFAKYLVNFKENELERDRALIIGILAGYEFAEGWSLLAGPGVEFEKNKNLVIFRSSIDYVFDLGNEWGLFPAFSYDFKQEYSSWSVTVGVSKTL